MKKDISNFLTVMLLAGGGVCMAAGIMRGEALTVLRKAIVICLECIGIG